MTGIAAFGCVLLVSFPSVSQRRPPASPTETPELSASLRDLARYRQSVPRPEVSAPGTLPPWHLRVPGELRQVSIDLLRDAVVPLDRDELAASRPVSAVLIPILDVDGDSQVLLTRRAASLSLDPGNISFPGGHLEAGEHPLDAALREAEEEIGLLRANVEVIGSLDLVERLRDGQRVSSIVGVVGGHPELVAATSEVEAILAVPLSALLSDGAGWQEHWGETRRPMHFFHHELALGDDLVWGLTARILWDLLSRVARLLGSGK